VFGLLKKKPQNALVLLNQKAQLNCSTDGAASDANHIEWSYDHGLIVFPPCVSQDQNTFKASAPNQKADCNLEVTSWKAGDVSGAYVCSDRTEKAIAMVISFGANFSIHFTYLFYLLRTSSCTSHTRAKKFNIKTIKSQEKTQNYYYYILLWLHFS